VPPRTVYDIAALLEQYKPDPIKINQAKEVLAQLPPVDADNATLARFYFERARAADQTGNARQKLDDYRKAREYVRGNIDTWWVLDGLANAEAAVGNLRNGVDLRKQAIQVAGDPSRAIHNYAVLIGDYIHLGDMAAAREGLVQLEQAMTSLSRGNTSGWFKDTYLSRVEQGRALYSWATGKYALAEAQFRKSIAALEDYIELTPRIPISAGRTGAISGQKQRREGLLIWLSRCQIAQGNFADAEVTLREALKSALSERGLDNIMAQYIVVAMASLVNQTGRFKESELVSRNTLRTLESIGAKPESSVYLYARSILTDSLVGQGRWKAALDNQSASIAGLAGDPQLLERFQRNSVSSIVALLRDGQYQRADALLERKLTESREWLGNDHVNTAALAALQAVAKANLGELEKSLQVFRYAIPILLRESFVQGEDASVLRTQRLKLIFEVYMALLTQIRGTPLEHSTGIDAAEEGFLLADAVRSQSTQAAVAASATRAAANDLNIGGDIRKAQDLDHELASLHKILRDLMNVPPDQQLPKVISDMKLRIAAIKTEKQEHQADIEKRFPAYANLIRPRPPSVSETRAVLQPGEALINIFTTDAATYLWAFKKDGPVVFTSVKLNRDELALRVRNLRKALDPGDVDLTKGIPDFDLDTAYRLYADLLAPVAAGWQGASHLLVAANGALGQLPLAVLPTAKVTVKPDPKLPYGQFKDVPWLVRQAAFTQLPSVNALVVLRKLPGASPQRSAFVGFGDPQFGDSPIRIASNTRRLRNLEVSRPSQAEVAQAKPAEWMDYGQIPPLPDTRDEILALAKALKADPATDVFLGSQASTANVKKLDLSKRRVVAFATHGLLAGDFPGVAEPSLALANPGGGQHGLLTLEDIMGLKLDADWVVLSACNTAAGDGQGADALSGLGRGFFYAGSRALLVTHWPVESVSARMLVSGIFERQAADGKLSRAEALRQSMLALMQQNSAPAHGFSYAHPLFWAPYALVGEGGI